ncbi:putative MmcJ protein [Streptomyces sp. Tu6071]|nr:putative MmcJ protein [Streptomyces sp. Tu6071]
MGRVLLVVPASEHDVGESADLVDVVAGRVEDQLIRTDGFELIDGLLDHVRPSAHRGRDETGCLRSRGGVVVVDVRAPALGILDGVVGDGDQVRRTLASGLLPGCAHAVEGTGDHVRRYRSADVAAAGARHPVVRGPDHATEEQRHLTAALGHQRVVAAGGGLAAPHALVGLDVAVEPLARAARAQALHDEVVGPSSKADAEGETPARDTVDALCFLGQEVSGPDRAEQDVADEPDPAGGARRRRERDRVHHPRVGDTAHAAQGGEARVLGTPCPFRNDVRFDIAYLIGDPDTDLHELCSLCEWWVGRIFVLPRGIALRRLPLLRRLGSDGRWRCPGRPVSRSHRQDNGGVACPVSRMSACPTDAPRRGADQFRWPGGSPAGTGWRRRRRPCGRAHRSTSAPGMWPKRRSVQVCLARTGCRRWARGGSRSPGPARARCSRSAPCRSRRR